MRTYGEIVLIGSAWTIVQLEPHVSIKLKNLFPKIRKSDVAPFHFDSTPESCADLQWFMERYPLKISEPDRTRLTKGTSTFFKTQHEMERILHPDYAPKDYPLREGQQLRHYQSQAIEVFKRTKALLIGDEVGLGKSYIAAGSVLFKEQLPALIVVQPHLQRQWKSKMEIFTPLKIHCIKGTRPYSLPPADVYVMRYSCLSGWVDFLVTGFFKTCVFDEIQELRRGTASDKGAAARAVAWNAEYRMGLTATPIYNYGPEMWEILNILKQGCLGTKHEFLREWSRNDQVIEDPKALGTYLREQYLFLRRTRADVGQYLEPVNKIVETVGFDEMAVKSAEQLAIQLAIRASTGSFIERGKAARELDMLVRKATGISKAKYVAEYVRIILETGEPVLLVGWHRDVYQIWLRELASHRPVMYTGTETPAQKDRAEKAFVNGDSNLMIISLRSGVGLDSLQARCSIVVFGELDWSPGIHHQVIGRLDREGQTRPVMAIFLCSDSGSDPLMVDTLGLKASQAQGITDPSLGVQAVHSDERRVMMLVQQYLKKRRIEPPWSHEDTGSASVLSCPPVKEVPDDEKLANMFANAKPYNGRIRVIGYETED